MVSFYVDDDPNGMWMNLGGTVDVHKAFAEIARVTNDDATYPELYGVLETCADQEGTSPEWRAKVQAQAEQAIKDHEKALSPNAIEILNKLRVMQFSHKG